ncbi:MAG: hypothetical protein K2X74_02315 [Acetobacteraceae bacterium]|nr:hypothetical protein [Acetobacteraceae bacterium]
MTRSPLRPIAGAFLLALAGACAATPPHATAVLPRDAVDGIGDPTRAAVLGSAYAFSDASHLAGQPAAAARAAAQVEYLAVEIATGPRYVEWSPAIAMQLQGARAELRHALGIPAASQPQAVVDALYAAARALQRGDRAAAEAALQAAEATDRPTLLVRLAALPPLPRTRTATALAHQELVRVDQDQRLGGVGSNDGGKD